MFRRLHAHGTRVRGGQPNKFNAIHAGHAMGDEAVVRRPHAEADRTRKRVHSGRDGQGYHVTSHDMAKGADPRSGDGPHSETGITCVAPEEGKLL